jgi:hypothetical protein
VSTVNETLKNLKADTDWCIIEIRAQMLTAMKALQAADECQAIIRGTIRETEPPIPPTWFLVEQVKEMLDHTRNLKAQAELIHENTRKLDHYLCQLETLEKEEGKCETR